MQAQEKQKKQTKKAKPRTQTNQKKAEGMGAIPSKNGTTFRVWAPNADKVSVIGDFNNWEENKNSLEPEDNGYWSVYVPKAKAGQEYKYLIHNGDQKLSKNDPYAQKLTADLQNSVIFNLEFKWEDDGFRIADLNKLVIYELHVGTFFRPEDSEVGKFDDVVSRLNYLKTLGINAIEIMPVSEFPGEVSWGYNISYPFAIENDYGGPEGFANLVNAAHKLGIAVIVDVVFNHFGPSELDLWRFDGWSENDKGGIYFYNDDRAQTPWGETRPDYGRSEVRRYIRDYAFMWLEKFNCDGLRIDGTCFIRDIEGCFGDKKAIEEGISLMREINQEINSKFPHKFIVAEDLQGETIITESLDNGGIGFTAQWDHNFVHPVRDVLKQVNDSDRDLQVLIDALNFKYGTDAYKRIIYCESHDEVNNGKSRLPEEIQPGEADSHFAKKRATLGAVLTFTAPGIPMIFQGQEFLSDKYFKDDEEMDWEKFSQFKGITRLFKDLIGFRTSDDDEFAGLRGQDIHFLHINPHNKVLVYERIHQDRLDNKLIVVMNLSHEQFPNYTAGVPAGGTWKLVFNSSSKEYDRTYEDPDVNDFNAEEKPHENCKFSGTFTLPAYTALIFTNKQEQ